MNKRDDFFQHVGTINWLFEPHGEIMKHFEDGGTLDNAGVFINVIVEVNGFKKLFELTNKKH